MGQGAALSLIVCSRRSALAFSACLPLSACQPQREITGEFTGTSPELGHKLRAPRTLGKPSVTHTVNTLIVGGGVAGLSATRALLHTGVDDFALLELELQAGGNARAGSMAGMAHPLGAHYLPVPGDNAPETQDFLQELGLRHRVAGRWQYDERYLCHSPQERLYFKGAWQEGLLPTQGVGKETFKQYAQFALLIASWQATGGFQIPVSNSAAAQQNKTQLALPFDMYLDKNGITDGHLRWYLDYCCRDDYGAGIEVVSAWAGIHYFAARHGFSAPAQHNMDGVAQINAQRSDILTWPQGNAFLTQALAKPLGDRLRTGRLVLRMVEEKHRVVVDAFNTQTLAIERWQAQRCIVALPIFLANKVLENAPEFLKKIAKHTSYSNWVVANVYINAPLLNTVTDKADAAPAWDNVIYNSGGLGYVDAMHQSTRTTQGATVLTYYRALGINADARRKLLDTPWRVLRDEVLVDLSQAHPDIWQRAEQVNITRYGHAMAVPTPNLITEIGLIGNEIWRKQLSNKERNLYNFNPQISARTQRLRFAHSDWSGYSVFEEAFRSGMLAALG